MPFIELGTPTLDLIDFDYPPRHEDTNTMERLRA